MVELVPYICRCRGHAALGHTSRAGPQCCRELDHPVFYGRQIRRRAANSARYLVLGQRLWHASRILGRSVVPPYKLPMNQGRPKGSLHIGPQVLDLSGPFNGHDRLETLDTHSSQERNTLTVMLGSGAHDPSIWRRSVVQSGYRPICPRFIHIRQLPEIERRDPRVLDSAVGTAFFCTASPDASACWT
jgi:hypothetical protein